MVPVLVPLFWFLFLNTMISVQGCQGIIRIFLILVLVSFHFGSIQLQIRWNLKLWHWDLNWLELKLLNIFDTKINKKVYSVLDQHYSWYSYDSNQHDLTLENELYIRYSILAAAGMKHQIDGVISESSLHASWADNDQSTETYDAKYYADKNDILDLCHLHHPTIMGHKMKTPHASSEI